MQSRPALLAILLLALLAAAALFLFDRRASQDPAATGAGVASSTAAGELDPGRAEADEPGAITREKIRPPASGAGAAGSADPAHLPAPVHLRVTLQVDDDQGGLAPPPGCRGWLVLAQTWDRETHAVTSHEAHANRRGIAEFVFEDAVHVDWVACQPVTPRWGYSFYELHADIGGGETVEWTLPLRLAGRATGLVLDARNRPVAGALVHVYNPDWSYGFDNWTPGFLSASTDAGGRYRFPSLAEGGWVFAVEPLRWLQYQPALGAGSEGEDLAEIAAGQETEVGALRVIAADGIEVEVVDADGRPVPQAQVWAKPLSFADPALGAPAEEEEQGFSGDPLYERFLAGQNWEELLSDQEVEETEEDPAAAADFWAHETPSRVTDERGRVRFAIPAGVWRFGCWLEVMSDGEMAMPAQEVRVPGPPLRLTLPFRLRSFAGRLVNERGEPWPGAGLALMSLDGSSSVATDSDSGGRFAFPAAPAAGLWRLQAWAENAVACCWTVELSAAPESVFLLPERAPIVLQFRTPDGELLQQDNGYLTIRHLQWELPPAPPGARAGEPQWTLEDGSISMAFEPDVSGLSLLPGSYEVTLGAHAWQGEWTDWGPRYEPREIARWIVSPRPEPWVLTATPLPIQPAADAMARIRGVARSAATGEALAQVEITARRGRDAVSGTMSGDDGSYELQLPPGPYVLAAQLQDHAFSEHAGDFAPGPHEHDFLLQPGAVALTALLRDRNGLRVPPCTVWIYSGAASNSPAAQSWSQDGRLQLAGLPAGSLILEAEFWGAIRARGRLEARAGVAEQEVRLDLTLDELRAQLRENPPQVQHQAFYSGDLSSRGWIWSR